MLNQGWLYRERVPRDFAGWSVLAYYAKRYRHSEASVWEARVVAGEVRVEGRVVSPTYALRAGESLCYARPPWEEPAVPLDIEVLYEDAEVLVVAKPSGLPVMPAGGFLQHTLWWQMRQRYPKDPPIPVHRLGRGTSGILLLARTAQARASLSQQLRQSTAGHKGMRKSYRALVGESDLPAQFLVDAPIGKVEHPLLGQIYAAHPQGSYAYSEGQVLGRRAGETLVEMTIATGRPHQIRIHLAVMGFPLLGDPLYGVGGKVIVSEKSGGLGGSCTIEESRGSEVAGMIEELRGLGGAGAFDGSRGSKGEGAFDGSRGSEGADVSEEWRVALPGDGGYALHACQVVFQHPRTCETMEIHCAPPARLAW